jgi:Fe-S-cluster containining protein
MSKAKTPFWENGIRFECQGTGRCCTSRGSYGYVYLSIEDRRRFAKFFKMATQAFTRKYCAKHDGHFHLKYEDRECQFLVKGKSCSVYEARPNQCRTWPFWPENMNPRAWTKEVVAFCPGVGKGRLYTKEEIALALSKDPVDPVPLKR